MSQIEALWMDNDFFVKTFSIKFGLIKIMEEPVKYFMQGQI